jgi:hypothetical protein
MALELPEWKVRAYAQNVHHLAQQSDSTLMGLYRAESRNAERIGFDRLAAMEGVTPTSRFAPTPNVEGDHTRRWVFPRPWRFGKLVDNLEKIQQIHDPRSEYAIAGAAALNREHDRRLIAAATGSALEGEETVISVPLPVGQTIVHATTGLTRRKITQARAKLDRATNSDRSTFGPYVMVYDPDDILYLFADNTTTGEVWISSDFMAGQALMEGKPLAMFMGFMWKPSTLLPVSTGNIRTNIAYAKMGIGKGDNPGVNKQRMDERTDLSYAAQIFLEEQFDFVRIDDALVVGVEVDTTAVPT